MTKSIHTTWELPTTRDSGNPLPVEDIIGVDVWFSADGGSNYVSLGTVSPTSVQENFIPDLVDGSYMIRLVVRDTNGKLSVNNVDTPILIDTSAPGSVINVVVTLS